MLCIWTPTKTQVILCTHSIQEVFPTVPTSIILRQCQRAIPAQRETQLLSWQYPILILMWAPKNSHRGPGHWTPQPSTGVTRPENSL
jgi:hypothetical protein